MKNKKRKLMKTILISLLLISIMKAVYASEEYTVDQEEFGVEEFVLEATEYTGGIFTGDDIQEMLEELVQGKLDSSRILVIIGKYLGQEVAIALQTITSILVIVIIHSILKAISENLETTNISKIIYYVQYILIVTIIVNSFLSITELTKTTADSLVSFINMLLPLLMTLMIYTGNIVAGGIIEPIFIGMINFIANMIQGFVLPMVLIYTTLNIVSNLSDTIKIDKITKFMKSSVMWFFSIMLTIFFGILSMQGTLVSSIDGITTKTAKSIVSSSVPVVGKILADAVDSILRKCCDTKKRSRNVRRNSNNWNMRYASY